MQTMYERLQAHLTKHAYKRGANKGDAPLDSARRGRSHERVSTRPDHMAVRFWDTDVIRAYPDGRIVLNSGGWYMSSTTRTCINDALRWFGGNKVWLYSDRLYGKTQMVLKVIGGNRYAYYDGIVLGADGAVLSELKPFVGKRIDRTASREFRAEMKECGFKDVFPLLHAVSEHQGRSTAGDDLRETVMLARNEAIMDYITSEIHANKWPYVVERVSFVDDYDYKTRSWIIRKRDVTAAWDILMEQVKRKLYNTVEIKEDTASRP